MQHFSDCDGRAIFRVSSKNRFICPNSYQNRMECDLLRTSSKCWLIWVGVHSLNGSSDEIKRYETILKWYGNDMKQYWTICNDIDTIRKDMACEIHQWYFTKSFRRRSSKHLGAGIAAKMQNDWTSSWYRSATSIFPVTCNLTCGL
jgi:hypothetical protein